MHHYQTTKGSNISYAIFSFILTCWNLEKFEKLYEKDPNAQEPACDSVCEQNGARQPDYDDFSSLNKTALASLCDSVNIFQMKSKGDIGYCRFNVKIKFDFHRFAWVKNDGSEINDFAWADERFPEYRDVLVYFYADFSLYSAYFTRPVSHS